jgi:hypothetical protein
MKEQSFNAGVYGVNLDLWRQRSIGKEVLYWMDLVSSFCLLRWQHRTEASLLSRRECGHY